MVDEFVIMPYHLQGILIIDNSVNNYHGHDSRGVMHYAPTGVPQFRSLYQTRGAIVRGFKSVVTKSINRIRDRLGCPEWQRDYCEHIVRNEKELVNIRQQITINPLK